MSMCVFWCLIVNILSKFSIPMLWSCKTMLDWNHWHACLVVCVKKKDWVKEGWQGDNCMESEHSSWEPSLSLSQQRGRPSEVIYVSSGDGSWRAEGRPPSGITDWRYTLQGLQSLSSPSFSHSCSLSISHLSDLHQRAATVSLGEGGREEEKGKLLILNAIFSCLTVKLYSSHTPVVCRALLGFALL